jgi:hypothetical protein
MPRIGANQRQRILERDSFVCHGQACFDREAGPFEIHHVVGLFYAEMDPQRWTMEVLNDDNNLVTLCSVCHAEYSAAQAALRAKLKRINNGKKPRPRRWRDRQAHHS